MYDHPESLLLQHRHEHIAIRPEHGVWRLQGYRIPSTPYAAYPNISTTFFWFRSKSADLRAGSSMLRDSYAHAPQIANTLLEIHRLKHGSKYHRIWICVIEQAEHKMGLDLVSWIAAATYAFASKLGIPPIIQQWIWGFQIFREPHICHLDISMQEPSKPCRFP